MECKIGGIKLYYEVFGEGRPIVFIHGLGLDYRSLYEFAEPLFNKNKDWKRIYLDLPGMGLSEYADWIKNSEQMLDIVLDFIDFLIPGESFLLAGYSYGGYLSMGVAYKKKQKVDGLFLLCPVVLADHAKRRLPCHKPLTIDLDFLNSLTDEQRSEFTSIAIVQNQQMWEKADRTIFTANKLAESKFIVNLAINSSYPFSFESEMLSEKFNEPALVVTGRQDAVVGSVDTWRITATFPRATFATLDMAGHNLQIEKETLLGNLVEDWLDRVVNEQPSVELSTDG